MCYLHWERERETPVGGLCCGYTVRSPRIHGSESGNNTGDWFLHSTHHKNGFIWLFLCMCLMLVISCYALPLFSFYIDRISLSLHLFLCIIWSPVWITETRLLCDDAALPFVDSFDVLYIQGLCFQGRVIFSDWRIIQSYFTHTVDKCCTH